MKKGSEFKSASSVRFLLLICSCIHNGCFCLFRLKTALPMALSVDTKKLTVKTKATNFGQDEI